MLYQECFSSQNSFLFIQIYSVIVGVNKEKESLIPLKFITASDFKMPIKSWFHFELSAVNSQTSVLYMIIPYFVKSNEIQIVRVEKKLCMYNIWNWKFIKLNIFQNKLHVLQKLNCENFNRNDT